MNPLNHVAIIMDGNGRWGLKHKTSRNEGHKAGFNTVEKIIKESIKQKIKYLTLYAFSTENWNRPKKEINYLFNLLENFLFNKIEDLNKQNIKLNIIGVKNFSKKLNKLLISSEKKTSKNSILQINLALNYGSKLEIISAIKKLSKNKENFGKGEPDGIIAAESANNAMVGPSLVPLLTLGVPGSPTAAVLLGGLLIHGMFPGPNLFTIYAETTWTFINSLLVAQFMMLIFGLYISGLAKYVIKTPTNYMAAGITILAIFGTYSVQHNFADVIVMLFLGVSMFFLSKFGFTAAPIVLGLILGPIAETNFSQAKIIADTQEGIFRYLTSGYLNLTIITLCIISIVYGIVSEMKRKNA